MYILDKIKSKINKKPENKKVEKVFFVLSTGRCGTKFIANLLNLSPETTVFHEPQPGLEFVNPIGHALYLANKTYYKDLKVEDISLLNQHAQLYKNVDTPVFGDCYNSLYPFGLALFKYYQKLGIECKIIQLVRHPKDCCKSILKMEGNKGFEDIRIGFNLRAKSLYTSTSDVTSSVQIWENINENIAFQRNEINKLKNNSAALFRIEDLKKRENVISLFEFLEIKQPSSNKIDTIFDATSYDVKHSHQNKLASLGINNYTEADFNDIIELSKPLLSQYGY